MPIERPQLASHVAARKYLRSAAGKVKSSVVVHDLRNGRAIELGQREWAVLSLLDGTRDREGVLLAVNRRTKLDEDELAAFLDEVELLGLIVQGESGGGRSVGLDGPTESIRKRALPIEHLPDFLLDCDGSGSCCRFYPSILFSTLEAAKARAALPLVLGGGEDEPGVFFPDRGNDRTALSVACVDGRCAYLGEDGRCGIHALRGGQEKPIGCTLYPCQLISDGEKVRAIPALECRCVFASARPRTGPSGGARLIEPMPAATDALHEAIIVDDLPERIRVRAGVEVARADLAGFEETVRRLYRAVPIDSRDAATGFFALSEHLASAATLEPTGGLDLSSCRTDAAVVSRAATVLLDATERLLQGTFRGPSDLGFQTLSLIEIAARLLATETESFFGAFPQTRSDEDFYFETVLFGHSAVMQSRGAPLSLAFFDRGMRVLIARAMTVAASLAELTDPVFDCPLALVEATLRSYGLGTYVDDIVVQ